MLPCNHKKSQNFVRKSVTHSPAARVSLHFFFPHFDVICDLLLLRRIATWNNLLRRFFKVTSAIEKVESRLTIVEVKVVFSENKRAPLIFI